MLSVLGKLQEVDFEVLRGPLESGRQSPNSLGFALILGIIFQPMLYALEYFVAADLTIFPYKEEILRGHFWLTAVLVFLSIIYVIPVVYKISEKMQYLVSILVSQNLFSISIFICALFLIAKDDGEGKVPSSESLLNFTYITFGIGLIIFIVTFIRFYILLRKGHYRKGSKKDQLRGRFENTSYVPATIIGSLGLVFIIQYIARFSAINDLNIVIVIVIGIALFFVMLFVLPEQLVILYCKFRFKSFNFNERGYLNKIRKGD